LYIGFYTVNNIVRSIVLARGDIPPLSEFDFSARSVYVDRSTANIFAVSTFDNNIYQLDSDPINNTVYEWKSKKFVMPNPTNFGAAKVQADFAYMDDLSSYQAIIAEIIAANNAIFTAGTQGGALNNEVINALPINGSNFAPIPPFGDTRYINFILYADGVQIFAKNILDQEPFRMPALQKGYVYEILLSGNVPVRMAAIASSIGELRQVAP
jgi:hypothetical protein